MHSHRFAAANTAVASVNNDAVQLKETEDFLKSGFITADLFAATEVTSTPGQVQMLRRVTDARYSRPHSRSAKKPNKPVRR